MASKSNANLKMSPLFFKFVFFSLLQKTYLPYISSPITYKTEFDNVQIIVIYSTSIENYCVLLPLSPDDYFILYYDPAIGNSKGRSWEKFMQFDEKLF